MKKFLFSATCILSNPKLPVSFEGAYDGDTVIFNYRNVSPPLGGRIGVRQIGVDCPELKTKDPCEKEKAIEAQKITQDLICRAQALSYPEATFRRDKYFRLLADLSVDTREIDQAAMARDTASIKWMKYKKHGATYSLKDVLLKSGLCCKYDGEKKIKRNWCSVDPCGSGGNYDH